MSVAALVALLPALALPAAAETAIRLTPKGYETRCAEMDNVLVELAAPAIGAFTLTARHPPYFGAGMPDFLGADFTDCVFPDEPITAFDDPFSATLYEDERFILRGHRLSRSWRPEQVPVTVGSRTWPGLHLLQLIAKFEGREIEAAVLYPSDGYWRIKPLPPTGRRDTGYGASVLIGPVETDRRPLVRLSHVRFDPEGPRFALGFARGGMALVELLSVARHETTLGVTLDMPAGHEAFAMLSSMYVTPDKADIATVSLRAPHSPLWREMAIDRLTPVRAAEVLFGRAVPSRHNTSAPDMLFSGFRPLR